MPAEPVRELAPGVWNVRSGGESVLAVAFSDHVLDAPPRGAPDVISRLATLAPGKPIRYVVATHHHDDQFTGVRHYAALGATTVTTPGNLDYFKRVMAAPLSTLMANQAQAPAAPSARVEAIANKRRVFTDGTRTVEIHDIGPNPHAEEMLVAWLPAEGILFQADLIEAPPSGAAQCGANAAAATQLADLIRRQGWNVRVFGGAHAFMASPAAFEELIRKPILPPS